jgi:hypothetical protein
MKVKFKFSNGQVVTDKVSGIKGTIDQSTVMNTGNIQYSILPKSKDGLKREESWFVDEDSLQVEEGKIAREYTLDFKFETNTKAKDKITGFEGYVSRAIVDLNKCVRYILVGEYNYKKGEPNRLWADEKQLEQLEAPKIDMKKSRTGCVSTPSTYNNY